MTFHRHVLCAAVLATGCNLFTAVDEADDRRPGGADMAVADVASATDGSRDVAPPSDTGNDTSLPDSSMRDASMDAGDARPPVDMSMPDMSVPDGCVPMSDQEICVAAVAQCGSYRASGGPIVEVEAENATSNECGFSGDFVTFCNGLGRVTSTIDFPQTGDYRIELVAEAQQLGAPAAIAAIFVDGMPRAQIAVRAVRGDAQAYEIDLPFDAGMHELQFGFGNDAVANGGDRNLYLDKFKVTGPLRAIVDNCAQTRNVMCGACGSNETCGFEFANECGCACPMADGTCAAVGPHATDPCLECGADGWFGVGGVCDDGDACTNDACHAPSGLCRSTEIPCVGGECEVGMCVAGGCQFTPVPDAMACGVAGLCTAGLCGCADGVTTETNCTDSNDNDCDGLLNCADPDCDGMGCQGNKTCIAGLCQ